MACFLERLFCAATVALLFVIPVGLHAEPSVEDISSHLERELGVRIVAKEFRYKVFSGADAGSGRVSVAGKVSPAEGLWREVDQKGIRNDIVRSGVPVAAVGWVRDRVDYARCGGEYGANPARLFREIRSGESESSFTAELKYFETVDSVRLTGKVRHPGFGFQIFIFREIPDCAILDVDGEYEGYLEKLVAEYVGLVDFAKGPLRQLQQQHRRGFLNGVRFVSRGETQYELKCTDLDELRDDDFKFSMVYECEFMGPVGMSFVAPWSPRGVLLRHRPVIGEKVQINISYGKRPYFSKSFPNSIDTDAFLVVAWRRSDSKVFHDERDFYVFYRGEFRKAGREGDTILFQ